MQTSALLRKFKITNDFKFIFNGICETASLSSHLQIVNSGFKFSCALNFSIFRDYLKFITKIQFKINNLY